MLDEATLVRAKEELSRFRRRYGEMRRAERPHHRRRSYLETYDGVTECTVMAVDMCETVIQNLTDKARRGKGSATC